LIPKGERFDGAIRARLAAVDHPLGEEAFGAQVVHREIGVIGRHVARRAFRLSEKEVLSAEFGLRCFAWIELSVDSQFWRRREIEQCLELSHRVHLATALEGIDALLGRDHGISIEVGGALFKLGEVFHGLQRALGPKQALNVHTAQTGRVDAMTMLLWTNVADEVGGAIAVPVGVTVETRHAAVRFL